MVTAHRRPDVRPIEEVRDGIRALLAAAHALGAHLRAIRSWP
jgi:hypothetical protein